MSIHDKPFTEWCHNTVDFREFVQWQTGMTFKIPCDRGVSAIPPDSVLENICPDEAKALHRHICKFNLEQNAAQAPYLLKARDVEVIPSATFSTKMVIITIVALSGLL